MKKKQAPPAPLEIPTTTVEADALYGRGKSVEQNLFGAGEFRGKDGSVEITPEKVERLFGNAQDGKRFGRAINDAREYLAEHPQLESAARDEVNALLDELECIRGLADDKRAIGSLRNRLGPSSPAIERLGKQLARENISSDAITSPAGHLNARSSFLKEYAEGNFGKSFGQLDHLQKGRLMKAFVWQSMNSGATRADTQAALGKILKGG